MKTYLSIDLWVEHINGEPGRTQLDSIHLNPEYAKQRIEFLVLDGHKTVVIVGEKQTAQDLTRQDYQIIEELENYRNEILESRKVG